MSANKLYAMKFSDIYRLYLQKAERKQRTQAEVDQVICWLTGYDQTGLQQQLARGVDVAAFFMLAPAIHPNSVRITGTICGVRLEEIDDPLMRHIRYLDKLVDELAKGRPMEKILRQ